MESPSRCPPPSWYNPDEDKWPLRPTNPYSPDAVAPNSELDKFVADRIPRNAAMIRFADFGMSIEDDYPNTICKRWQYQYVSYLEVKTMDRDRLLTQDWKDIHRDHYMFTVEKICSITKQSDLAVSNIALSMQGGYDYDIHFHDMENLLETKALSWCLNFSFVGCRLFFSGDNLVKMLPPIRAEIEIKYGNLWTK